MLVGVTGYAQHGKDTVAQVLVEDFGFVRVGFADALKDLAYRANPSIPGVGSLKRLVDSVGWEEAKKWAFVRRFLQELGTGARDIIGPNVWVDALAHKLRWGYDVNVVVPDVRFPNEAEYIQTQGGLLWRATRTGFDNGLGTEHPSEMYVSTLPAKSELFNGGSLKEFVSLVRACAGEWLGEVPTWASND